MTMTAIINSNNFNIISFTSNFSIEKLRYQRFDLFGFIVPAWPVYLFSVLLIGGVSYYGYLLLCTDPGAVREEDWRVKRVEGRQKHELNKMFNPMYSDEFDDGGPDFGV